MHSIVHREVQVWPFFGSIQSHILADNLSDCEINYNLFARKARVDLALVLFIESTVCVRVLSITQTGCSTNGAYLTCTLDFWSIAIICIIWFDLFYLEISEFSDS